MKTLFVKHGKNRNWTTGSSHGKQIEFFYEKNYSVTGRELMISVGKYYKDAVTVNVCLNGRDLNRLVKMLRAVGEIE